MMQGVLEKKENKKAQIGESDYKIEEIIG